MFSIKYNSIEKLYNLFYIDILYNMVTNKKFVKIFLYTLFFFSPFIYIYFYSFIFFISSYIRQKRTYAYLMIIALAMIISTRVQTGDIEAYKNFFLFGVNDFFMIPHYLLMKLASNDFLFGYYTYFINIIFFDNFTLYLFFTIYISLIIVYISFKNILGFYWIVGFLLLLATPLYSMIFSFTIRQGMAISLLLYGIILLHQNEASKSFLFIAISIFFHPSVTPALLLFIIIKFFDPIKFFILLYLLIILGLIFIGLDLNMVNSLEYLFIENTHVSNKLISYSYGYAHNLMDLFRFDFFKIFIGLSICLFGYNYLKEYKTIINTYLFFVLVQLLTFFNSVLFMRFSSLKDIFLILLLAIIIKKVALDNKTYLLTSLIGLSLIVNFYYTFIYASIDFSMLTNGVVYFIRTLLVLQ